ncbi:Autophagy-related 13 protein [Rutstroemia sp. NJR-2017a BBW]|nr:Autophagy-related 13 protein [Rutstroemia sp. NJR-2017a BBW]
MHQHPRPSPVSASPASSPRTNPTRTNNPREESRTGHSRSYSDMPHYNEVDDGSGDGGVLPSTGPSREAVKKLDQIIQNFYTKSAIVLLQSRLNLPVILNKDGIKKVNKWFQIETDDSDAFRDELSIWRTCGGFQNRPPPLIIETYLDTSALTNSQRLVIVDDHGKRWDVLDALSSSNGSNDGRSEVILERWRIELKDSSEERPSDFGSTLPTVYKKCIVFFRSLYSTAKIVPPSKFVKSLAKGGSSNGPLKVNCRITTGDVQPRRFDGLTQPLYDSNGPVTSDYVLGTTDTPAGQFSAEVSYRNDCNFRVDDSESLLSSRFMGADEQYFQPSLAARGDLLRRRSTKQAEIGSLPAHKQLGDDSEPVQTYGSLSTFHGIAPLRAESPISALRAQRPAGSDTSSPPVGSLPQARPLQVSKGSLKSLEGIAMARRPSLSFQPFKAGSLSSSPSRGAFAGGEMLPPPSPGSLPRTSGISALAQARNRSSLTAGMPATLRGGPVSTDNFVPSSASGSPKPAPISRYSSSFTHRRGRSSYGGASKLVDEDQGSSGKQSLSSSVQPGSGILAEGGGSSGSLQTDDDNISEFLKLLDSKKTLQSFEPSGEASKKRANAQLSKFQSMRDSHNALTESMSSSAMLQRSSSSSSRQLSSVPPMVAATSMSTSSSPGKPISPHTPHTPAIPSRLSANSIVEYDQPRRVPQRSRTAESRLQDVADDDQSNDLGTNAIDIPTSPRPYYPHNRRSSSVAQQHRSLAVDDDLGDLPFGVHRSISLGADDREPPSLSALLGIGQTSDDVASPNSQSPSRLLQPAPHISEASAAMSRQPSSSLEAQEPEAPQVSRLSGPGSVNSPYRPRLGRTGGRGVTPPQTGSYSSLLDRGSGSGSERAGGGRYSFSRNTGTFEADDEPLLFDMSEIGRELSRRSIDDPRGGGGNKGGDSGTSSRRGSSRRGW